MRHWTMMLALAMMLVACSRENHNAADKAEVRSEMQGEMRKERAYNSASVPAPAPEAAPAELAKPAPPPGQQAPAADARTRYLAYAHAVQVDTEAAKVAPLFESVQAACVAAAAEQCVVLGANLNPGTSPGATLNIRATAAGTAASSRCSTRRAPCSGARCMPRTWPGR